MDAEPVVYNTKEGIAQIARKMALVMGKIGRLEKRGKVDEYSQNYRYATNDDVVDTVREAMALANLALMLSVNEYQQEPIKSSKGKDGFTTTVDITFTLICGDTGESISSRYIGQSTDYGDKGFNKAVTSAEKYWLMKTFLVSAGDDPDAEVPEAGTRQAQKTTPPSQPNIPAWVNDEKAVNGLVTFLTSNGLVPADATRASIEKLLNKRFEDFTEPKFVTSALRSLQTPAEPPKAQQQPMKQTRSGVVSRATYNGKVIGLEVDEYEDSVPVWSRGELYDLIAKHSREYADVLDVKNWSGTKDVPLTCYPCLYITYAIDDKGGKKLTALALTDDYRAALLDTSDIPF